LEPRNYYYFVASLSPVSYGDNPPVSSGDFREHCYTVLEDNDAALLPYCRYDPRLAVETAQSTGSDFIDRFLARERTLVMNLASLRAGRLKRPSPEDPPHDAPGAEAAAKEAFEMHDPLEAEISMDKSRWNSLDAMVGVDTFKVNTIFAYLLKLQLLERRQRFDAERGTAAYRKLYDEILNEYNSKV
jgi:hypothetical protein